MPHLTNADSTKGKILLLMVESSMVQHFVNWKAGCIFKSQSVQICQRNSWSVPRCRVPIGNALDQSFLGIPPSLLWAAPSLPLLILVPPNAFIHSGAAVHWTKLNFTGLQHYISLHRSCYFGALHRSDTALVWQCTTYHSIICQHGKGAEHALIQSNDRAWRTQESFLGWVRNSQTI